MRLLLLVYLMLLLAAGALNLTDTEAADQPPAEPPELVQARVDLDRARRYSRRLADGLLEIRCRVCKQWKGASEFPSDRKSSRGYHRDCRECGKNLRQSHRDRRKVPCVRCGKPRTHPRDAGSQRDTGLCRACWHETRIA